MTSPSAQTALRPPHRVTRAREQASELAGKLAALGAEVIELPLIHVSKEISKQDLADVLLELGSYDWIVFTSANGVRHFFDEFFRIFDDIRSLGLLRMACVGEGTAKAVDALHLKVNASPRSPPPRRWPTRSSPPAASIVRRSSSITGNLNRDMLVQKLEGAGAIVDRLQVYKTEPTDLAAGPRRGGLSGEGGRRHSLREFECRGVVSSRRAAALKLAPKAQHPLVGSIGPQTSETMKKSGPAGRFRGQGARARRARRGHREKAGKPLRNVAVP